MLALGTMHFQSQMDGVKKHFHIGRIEILTSANFKTQNMLMVSLHIRHAHNLHIYQYVAVCHAAINAILNKNAESLKGCVLYTTLFPGHEDAKLIIQAGLKRVVYFDDKYHQHGFAIVARKLFEKAEVLYMK